MSSKGYTVGTYIIKSEKKNSDLPMCPICKKCKDKSICSNRKSKIDGEEINIYSQAIDEYENPLGNDTLAFYIKKHRAHTFSV